MPRHHQVIECRKSGGPVSKFCSCEHCTLSVCSVCGAAEGSLTTDCPGKEVDSDRQQEVYETPFDYTDERGWHQGEPMERRSPRFEKPAEIVKPKPATSMRHLPLLVVGEEPRRIAGCVCGWRTPQEAADLDDAFATHAALAKLSPSVDWGAADRAEVLRHDLAQKAIAWVLADRICDDRSAALTFVEDEVDEQRMQEREPDRELLGRLEREQIDFRLASQRAEKCDDEFRQAARKLVAELERVPRAPRPFVYRAELSADDVCDLVDALDAITSDKGREYESDNAPRLRTLRDRLADLAGTHSNGRKHT